MERLEVVGVSPQIIRTGLEFAEQYQLSFWDGVILAAAHAPAAGPRAPDPPAFSFSGPRL